MATWVKIILGLFAVGLLLAVVGSVFLFTFVQNMTNPKKTQEIANTIVTLTEPLPPPFEYGRMNFSMLGWSGALIDSTDSQACFFLIKKPMKEGEDSAQKTIDKVAKGEASLPDTSGSLPGSGASKAAAKSNMMVEANDVLDCGGTKLYYVKGKAVLRRTGAAAKSDTSAAPKEVETFLGGADPKGGQTAIFIMGQQPDSTKHLSME